MKEYRNTIYNFRVSYPEGWDYLERVYSGNDVIYFYYNKIADSMPNINLSIFHNQEASILEIVKATKHEIRNYLRRIVMIQSDITDDQEGVLIYEGERDGVRYHFKQVIVKRELETLSFTATCKAEVFDVYKEDMEKILLSIQFETIENDLEELYVSEK